jgi:hypothetical protein
MATKSRPKFPVSELYGPEPQPPVSERFCSGASLADGVSGRMRMDSTEYENTQTRGTIVPARHGSDE